MRQRNMWFFLLMGDSTFCLFVCLWYGMLIWRDKASYCLGLCGESLTLFSLVSGFVFGHDGSGCFLDGWFKISKTYPAQSDLSKRESNVFSSLSINWFTTIKAVHV